MKRLFIERLKNGRSCEELEKHAETAGKLGIKIREFEGELSEILTEMHDHDWLLGSVTLFPTLRTPWITNKDYSAGRKIINANELKNEKPPFFTKSVEEKGYPGAQTVKNKTALKNIRLKTTGAVIVGPVHQIKQEVRIFIVNGKAVGLNVYNGPKKINIDYKTAAETAAKNLDLKNHSLDFGKIENGLFLIEAHPLCVSGLYQQNLMTILPGCTKKKIEHELHIS